MTALSRPLPPVATGPSGAETDESLVALWLEGRSPHTARAYSREATRFFESVGKPLATVTLSDVYAYQRTLTGSPATVTRATAAVKSLLSFGQRVGYMPFNVGAPVRLRGRRDALAERILTEAQVHRMVTLEADARNRALLRFLYASGLRVSEATALVWANLVPVEDGGLVNTFGKGGKTRVVRVPASVWNDVWALDDDHRDGTVPVFRSARGGKLDDSAVHRIVSAAARRAGLTAAVSPHWLRHAHASHALDRGAPVSLVQATLGHATVATTGRYLHARPGESSGDYLAV